MIVKATVNEINGIPLILLDREYRVYGIMIGKNRVEYLLCECEAEHSRNNFSPTWIDAKYFDVVNKDVEYDWKINFLSQEKCKKYQYIYIEYEIISLIGYEKLIKDFNHYSGLIEGKKEDIEYFYRVNIS